jgi:HTH-type transcriptional regulator / antitoxin HigA
VDSNRIQALSILFRREGSISGKLSISSIFSLTLNTIRITGKMTLTFNRENYANLLVEVLPQPIQSQAEYQRVLAIVELLINKKDISTEEDRLLDLFVILVEKFESEHYPSPNRSTPHSRLLHLMEANNLRSVDLISVFGSSDIAADIIDGKCSIDKTHAQKLSDRFNLPATIFLI